MKVRLSQLTEMKQQLVAKNGIRVESQRSDLHKICLQPPIKTMNQAMMAKINRASTETNLWIRTFRI
jgi:hypothetical protein